MKKMEKKVLDIVDISYEGAGVGKDSGKVVFVPKTLIGEKIEAEIVKEGKAFSTAKLVNILKPSNKRVEPKCPHFDVCGGCAFQHCDYDQEIYIKKNIVGREFAKIGYDGEIGFVKSDKRYGYRNKIKLEVDGGNLGYFKEKSHIFFKIKRCPIAQENIEKNIEKIQKFIYENNFSDLKNIYFKEINKKLAICFLFDKHARKTNSEIKKIKNFDIFKGFLIYFAYGNILELNDTQIEKVYGDQDLSVHIDDFDFEIDVSAFNQVNDGVAQKLYDYVCDKCCGERIVNAYSGQGLLTYMLAKKSKFIYGIEYQLAAHNVAEKLCDHLSEYKVLNVCGKVEDELGEILLKDRIDAIVLDPSREGCREGALQSILESKIEKIIYVSCNFSTQVRDLRVLQEKYSVQEVTIFDMFPCCSKMETVAILRRNG